MVNKIIQNDRNLFTIKRYSKFHCTRYIEFIGVAADGLGMDRVVQSNI